MVYDYLEGGSEREIGLARNVDAFRKWNFVPRRLTDVSKCSLEAELFGRSYRLPFYISPTGLNGLIRPEGDRILAQAAARAGIPFVLSTASNMSIEEVAASGLRHLPQGRVVRKGFGGSRTEKQHHVSGIA
ncbi:alpha-hydroxy-acid oxidizing protein [Rhizobium bangladeshense]|uniref:alpha-hydroxy-acid oxidizing protein n=1 Tax=Rhizobium bangladeshense TaxID=1138189 RepID=UPI0034D971E4